jgi:CRISPR/Cas system CSM-associated protein Csm3 (group 7 of RAMP superfamily)
LIDATLKVTMLSEWLVAGGFDRSSGADHIQVRDLEGFPYIPGRTLRGLLREACRAAVECGADPALGHLFISLFGPEVSSTSSGGAEALSREREASSGSLAVTDALLPQEVVSAVKAVGDRRERQSLLRDFCSLVRRTAVGENGVAKEHTLRATEVSIPGLVFLAQVRVPDSQSLQLLAFAAGLVRRLGASRYRGLGRCQMEILVGDRPVEARVFPKSQHAETGHEAGDCPSN